MKKFDVTIIGSGPAGFAAALKLSKNNKKVCLIEKNELGGTCLNKGFIPTTMYLHTSEFLHKLKESESLGIEINGNFKINLEKLFEKKNKVVSIHRKGMLQTLKKNKVEIINGIANFIDNNTIEVTTKKEKIKIDSKYIIISTGSIPILPDAYNVDNKNIITSADVLNLKKLPEKIAIIGAGVTGTEFAFFFNELGSEVHLIDLADKILPLNIDNDVHKILMREIKKNKIKTYTSTKIVNIEKNEKNLKLIDQKNNEIIVEKILLTIGRQGNIKNLNLKSTDISLDKKDFININKNYETTVKNIFAVGDVAGKYLFAHTAANEGKKVADYILKKEICNIDIKPISKNLIPYTIFTFPEIAWIGLTEENAVKKGIEIKSEILHFRTLGRAHTMSEITGIIKLVVDIHSKIILGAHIIGPRATDLIHTIQMAMVSKLKINEVSEIIAAHPSISESIIETAIFISEK